MLSAYDIWIEEEIRKQIIKLTHSFAFNIFLY